MTAGIGQTIATLAASGNLAAREVLLELLFRGPLAHRPAALTALLRHPAAPVLLALVVNYHRLSRPNRLRLLEQRSRLSGAVREAYLMEDLAAHQNACSLIRQIPEYDAVPVLLTALSTDTPRKPEAGALLEHLTRQLLLEASLRAEQRSRHDFDHVYQRFVDSLRSGMTHFAQHNTAIVPECYMRLAPLSSGEVGRILGDHGHPCHRAVVGALRRRTEPEILRWFFALLATRIPSPVLLTILRERNDLVFVHYLTDHADALADPLVRQAFKHLTALVWLHAESLLLEELNEDRQKGAVILLIHSGIGFTEKLETLAFILDKGKPAGRQAAACALALLPGADANRLVISCLHDTDPLVQLAATYQLRDRGIPNAMGLLLQKLDHADKGICQAAREALSDYTFERYLGVFDNMDDATLRAAGLAILRIDPTSLDTLRLQLKASFRQQRLRATRVVRKLDLIDKMLPELVHLLADKDYLVRREAIEAMTMTDDPRVPQELAQVVKGSSTLIPATSGKGSLGGRGVATGAREALDHLRRFAPNPAQRQLAQQLFAELSDRLPPKPGFASGREE